MDFRRDILPLKDRLYRLALRITLSQQEAEDVVQDTLIKLWNRRDTWNEIQSIEAFAMTMCRNIALDHLKLYDNRNASLDTLMIDRPDRAHSPLESLQHTDSLERVRAIMNSLPEKQRTCMQLRDFEGKSYTEIAEILSFSEEQVKINIFRARKTVKEIFEKQENFGV